MILRRDVVLSLGGFDEAIGPGARFPSGDDWDIAHRVLLNGWHVYETATCQSFIMGSERWRKDANIRAATGLPSGACVPNPFAQVTSARSRFPCGISPFMLSGHLCTTCSGCGAPRSLTDRGLYPEGSWKACARQSIGRRCCSDRPPELASFSHPSPDAPSVESDRRWCARNWSKSALPA